MPDTSRTIRQQRRPRYQRREEARDFVPQVVIAARLEALGNWLSRIPEHPDYDIHDHMERWEKPLRKP